MALNVTKLIAPLAEPVSGVVESVANNVAAVKISNNELAGKLNDNRLAAYQTYSTNQLAKFTSAITAMQNIVTCVSSAITAGIDAYARIQVSHDQVRVTQIQSDAYVQGKREETEQVRIAQKEETLRCLAQLNAELETKKLEFAKFEEESRASREFKQEQWRSKVRMLENYFNPLFDYAKKIRDDYYASNFENEKCRAELERVEENISAYILKIDELYQ